MCMQKVQLQTVPVEPMLDFVSRPISVIDLLMRNVLFNPHGRKDRIQFYQEGFSVQLCSTSDLVSESENPG